MPRDKKTIHRATSDVENDDDDDEVVSEVVVSEVSEVQSKMSPATEEHVASLQQDDEVKKNLLNERKKYLKDIILKRNIALKQQRDREKHQKIHSTKQN